MEKTLFMGQLDIVKAPDVIKTTLGSCIGLILFREDGSLYGISHFMLPSSSGNDGKRHPGKYADTAIVELLKLMKIPLSDTSKLRAKIAGGSDMFAHLVSHRKLNIGQENIKAAKEQLKHYNIPIVAEDIGGDKGRQLTISSADQKIFVSQIGGSAQEL